MPDIVDLVLHVTGMDCGHCASRIDTVLGRAQGVRQANADTDCGQVRVQFDAALTTAVDLVDRIELAGFTVTKIERTDGS